MFRFLVFCSRVMWLSLLLLLRVPQLSAQCSPGGVNQLDANTFDINMGQSIPATGTLQTCSHPFTLPSPGRIVKIQGIVVLRGECAADTDTTISVNGGAKRTYHLKQKLGTGGGVSTVFVSFDVPLSYSSPNASLDFAAFIPSFCPSNPDWEFKGVMQVKQESDLAVSSTRGAVREPLLRSRRTKAHSTGSDRIKAVS
jgi:hypothetical protein